MPTRSAGTTRVSAPVKPPDAAASALAGRTVTSGAVCRKRSVKLLFRVSVKTKVPDTKATPSTIAKALIAIRKLVCEQALEGCAEHHGTACRSARRTVRALASKLFIRSSTRSAVGSVISSTMRPSARNSTRSA